MNSLKLTWNLQLLPSPRKNDTMQSPERQLPVLPINSANRNKSLESNQPTETNLNSWK